MSGYVSSLIHTHLLKCLLTHFPYNVVYCCCVHCLLGFILYVSSIEQGEFYSVGKADLMENCQLQPVKAQLWCLLLTSLVAVTGIKWCSLLLSEISLGLLWDTFETNLSTVSTLNLSISLWLVSDGCLLERTDTLPSFTDASGGWWRENKWVWEEEALQ